MKCLVTGAAGFIGSTLSERLLAEGHEVRGVDCFLDYYPRPWKERNLAASRAHSRFELHETSLVDADLGALCDGIDRIFHQAAQAGVRASWGREFHVYTENNVYATQRLLEAARDSGVKRFVYASSSSVYGDTPVRPMREDALPEPVSPYGVSKLAAEHLCRLYWKNFGLETVSLRYFTVYGPRQRPDMAFHRFLRAARLGEEVVLYDDGEQSRDFTYVSDAVDANVAAAESAPAGSILNVGGGSEVTINQVLATIARITGREVPLRRESRQKGDVRHTSADCSRARELIGFRPKVGLEEGLRREWEWIVESFPGKD